MVIIILIELLVIEFVYKCMARLEANMIY